ncbi:MAG TPA: hypothetical protein VFB21_24190 [Chthonomonadaceae bacterium]|jgi:hypothetical protein|nr:hypothetical protein [Chthonomonadaceae bacterium]
MLQQENAIETIRRNPKMYLPFGELRGDSLSTRLASDILSVSTRAVGILQYASWWIVASEEDWISKAQGEENIDEYFKRIVPFPEGGVNAMHAEILLTAFARKLITATPRAVCVSLIGSAPEEDLFVYVTRSLPKWKRLVAFQL